jgi:hypothetical protein
MSFGSRVAEDELDLIESYFVETAQWQQLARGDVDIVYGPKGSGKSALYSLLLKRRNDYFDRGIILIPAENPRGAAAFHDLEHDPPTSEIEFLSMWKLYFVVLLADALEDYGIESTFSQELLAILEAADLKRSGRSLGSIIRSVIDYLKRATTLEGSVGLDPTAGPTLTGKISIAEPSAKQRAAGVKSVDEVVSLADKAWSTSPYKAWLLLDRLDVAFADNPSLEENALRALFRAYLDFNDKDGFRLKIFLRSDIWQRLTRREGFREASHIVRGITISWDRQSLLNLILKRTLQNGSVLSHYEIDQGKEPRTYAEQLKFFERAFPDQIDLGQRKPKTIDWILTRTRDGGGQSAPREIIHLLTAARDAQLRSFDLGELDEGEYLIGRAPFKAALPEVSKVRLEQTIYAEYPRLRDRISQLEREKSEQRPETLAVIWNTSVEDARGIADQLVEIGFFELRGSKAEPQYWVPFLYRDALSLVQGAAPGTDSEDEG